MTDPLARELHRQATLLEAIDRPGSSLAALRLAGSAVRAGPTLAAWHANAAARAHKALRPVFPTVHAMLGDADFARLAEEHLTAHRPTCGDLGEWGADLPGFVGAHAGLADWPWLADTARLDLALHAAERGFDACFDPASLHWLQTDAPARLQLRLVPGCALIESAWPLAAIHAAHRSPGPRSDAAFADLREAIALGCAESVMIVREGWRATVRRLDAAGVEWVRSLLAGRTLAESLDRAGPAFDFTAWLATAVRRSWLDGVVRVAPNDAKDAES